jgi:hypothetical protein
VQAESAPYDPTAGQNPPYGAAIDYYLKSSPQGGVRLSIADSTGRTVRTLTGPALPGINRIWWDLRFTPTKQMRLRTTPEYAPEITVGPEGWRPAPGEQRIALLAPPGTYTVKLTVDGKDYTQSLKVLKDPHSNGSEGDIQLQTRLMTSLTTQIDGVVDAVNQIELLLAQLADLKAVLPRSATTAPVITSSEQLGAKLFEIEQKLIRTKVTGRGQDGVRWSPEIGEKLAYLANEVDTSDFQPTTQQVAVHDELKEQAATYRQRLRLLMEQEVAVFNLMLRQKNVPNLITEMR